MFENQVRKLVEAFTAPNTSDIELDRTIRKTARLLSSNTQYRGHESYENIIQKINQLINQNKNKGHEKSLYFLELAQKLQLSPHLTKKPELLRLLEILSQNTSILSHSNVMSYHHRQPRPQPHINNITSSSSSSSSLSSANKIIRPYANNKLQQEQYITDLIGNPIHRLDAPYNNTNFNGLAALKGEIVDELLLIRDILYASQGIETSLIEIRNNEFCAKSNLRLLPSQKILIGRLCLVGTLHHKLNNFIAEYRDYKMVKKGRNDGDGLVLQSFLGSLDEELTNLYELFACLHEKLSISFNQNCPIQEKMTLERLNIWFQRPLKRLQLLNRFCLSIRGLRGGQIISQIYKFCRTGNEFEYNFTESILNEICRPIFNMINRWIVEGILADPFYEFFIFERDDIELVDIWKKKYILIRKFIPIFINKKLAKQIYSIGRNLNFIRVCCKDNYSNNNNGNMNRNINISNLNEFEYEINKLAEITNKRLMELMMNKFKVMIHCEALRKYLLLGQGDFIEEFLIEIREEMNKNASFIKQHDIQSKLESAILNSNALYDDNDIKQRLKVKILKTNCGDIGWNVFSLKYCVDLPINIIFNDSVMKKYEKVFVFLMKIKLAKSVLNDCWKDQMRGNHVISIFPDIYYIKHCGYLVRNSMNELLQIFESYFMFDVLDASWKEFKCSQICNMDQLIHVHSKYINQIITKCFLNQNDEQKLKKPLEDILAQIHQFTIMYKELFYFLNNIQIQRDEQLKNNDLNEKEYQTQYQSLRKKQNDIIYILKSFHNKIAKLLFQLPKTKKIIPEYLERLLVQLDFNDFHFNNSNNNIISIDLPINPPPIQTFTCIQMKKKAIDKLKNRNKKNNKNQNRNTNISNTKADHMLSKLDAVLGGTSKSKPFVPSFVFPNSKNRNNNNENDKNSSNKHHFEKHRTTATMKASNHCNVAIVPTPMKETKEKDIFSKYNLMDSPKIDSRIPRHLLPTPLQKNKNKNDDSSIDSRAGSRSQSQSQINAKRSRSSSPQQHQFDFYNNQLINNDKNDNFIYKARTNGSGYADADDVNFDNANNANNHMIIDPDAIKFSFGNKGKEIDSPIPFSRNIGKINENDNLDTDQWSRFIPTPLINQGKKTKSYR